jgi:hypothetical protein
MVLISGLWEKSEHVQTLPCANTGGGASTKSLVEAPGENAPFISHLREIDCYLVDFGLPFLWRYQLLFFIIFHNKV